MTTTTTTNQPTIAAGFTDKKITDFLSTVRAEHNEAAALITLIADAQAKIDNSTPYLAQDRTSLSYYAPVAAYHKSQIEKYTTVRNDLISKYIQLAWKLYSKDLPVFNTPDCLMPYNSAISA